MAQRTVTRNHIAKQLRGIKTLRVAGDDLEVSIDLKMARQLADAVVDYVEGRAEAAYRQGKHDATDLAKHVADQLYKQGDKETERKSWPRGSALREAAGHIRAAFGIETN